MGLFDLFGRKKVKPARSLSGISLGMAKGDVLRTKGHPLEIGGDGGVEIFACDYDDLHRLMIGMIADRVIYIAKTQKVIGLGEEIIIR